MGLNGWPSLESDKNGSVLSDFGDGRLGLGVGLGWPSSESDGNGPFLSDFREGRGKARGADDAGVGVAELIRRQGSGRYGLLSRLYVADSSGCTMPGGLYMAPEPGYAKYQRCDSAPHTCDITSCVPCISHLAKRRPPNLPCIGRLAVAWGGFASQEHGEAGRNLIVCRVLGMHGGPLIPFSDRISLFLSDSGDVGAYACRVGGERGRAGANWRRTDSEQISNRFDTRNRLLCKHGRR